MEIPAMDMETRDMAGETGAAMEAVLAVSAALAVSEVSAIVRDMRKTAI